MKNAVKKGNTMGGKGEIAKLLPVLVLLAVALFGIMFFSGKLGSPTGLAAGGNANLPPEWTASSTKFVLEQNTPVLLNLGDLFNDPEGQSLTFSGAENLAVVLEGNTLSITPEPGFAGMRAVSVFASDGNQVSRKRLSIEVSESGSAQEPQAMQASPAAQQEEQPQEEPTHFVPESQQAPIVEQGIETEINSNGTVEAIITFKESLPVKFSVAATNAEKQDRLASRRAAVRQERQALLAKVREKQNGITGAAVADYDVDVIRTYETAGMIAVRLTNAGLEKLRNDPSVSGIYRNHVFTTDLSQSVPLIDADDVWKILTPAGNNLTGLNESVCIIDTGIDMSNPAFTGKIVGGYDFVNLNSNPQDDSANSHGTHVAGIVGANSTSVRGVAIGAKIVPVKVCDSAGDCDDISIIAGIDYCNDNAAAFNISVISGSLGDNNANTSENCPTYYDSLFITSASVGIIPVFASGNNGYTGGVSHPACSSYVIAVGSSSKSDVLDSFTNRLAGWKPEVLAPGSSIVSTMIGGGIGAMTGTSMATPHVAGTIAILQQNRRAKGQSPLTLAQVVALLQPTGKMISGFSRIDVLNAILKENYNYDVNLTDNSIKNATAGTKIAFGSTTDFANITSCSKLRSNFVEIDSVNCPQYNITSHIRRQGLAGNSASVLRNGVACTSQYCENVTFSSGTLDFDVLSFTNYSVLSSDIFPNITGCAEINTSTELAQNITFTGSSPLYCIRFNNHSTVLDCNGYWITRNTIGSNTIAIYASNKNNITIRNCNIAHTNASEVNDFTGILLEKTNTSFVFNNIVSINMTSTDPSGPDSWGISVEGNDNAIENNSINSSITSIPGPSYLIGLNISGLRNNATGVSINTWVLSGGGSVFGRGIFISGSNHSIYNSKIMEVGTVTTENYAILATATRAIFVNNTITGTPSSAISLESAKNCSFNKTTINATGTWISLSGSANDNNFTNTTFVMGNGSINVLGTFEAISTPKSDLNITYNKAFIDTGSHPELNQSAIISLYNVSGVNLQPQVDWNDDTVYDPCDAQHCTKFSQANSTLVFNVTHFTAYSAYDLGPDLNYSNITGCAVINRSTVLANNIGSSTTCIVVNNDSIYLDCFGYKIGFDGGGVGSDYGIIAENHTNITIRNCNIQDTSALGAGGIGILFMNMTYSRIYNNSIYANGSSGNGVLIASPAYSILSHNNTIENNTIFTKTVPGSYGIFLFNYVSDINITGNSITPNGTGVYTYQSISGVRIANNSINIDWDSIGNGIYTDGDAVLIENNHITFGAQSTAQGVITTGRNGIIRYNTITADSRSHPEGIRLESGSKNTIVQGNNISIWISYDAYGIVIGSPNNTVTGNSIEARGNISAAGIRMTGGAQNNTVAQNIINISPAMFAGITLSAYGLYLQGATLNNLSGNNITLNGTRNSYGIYFWTGVENNTVANNNMVVTGSMLGNMGMHLNGTRANNFTGNTIITNGTFDNWGILLQDSFENRFGLTNISTGGDDSYGIRIIRSNNSLFNATVLDNPVEWINASANTFNNFTNTTFANSAGSITIWPFQLNGSRAVTKNRVNVSYNKANVNSAALPELNTTGIVELRALLEADPIPQVDFEDDGSYIDCPAGVCTELSPAPSAYRYMVSHFTSYSSAENGTPIYGCPVTINTSAELVSDISSSGTCITIGNESVTLDCRGHTITYGNGGGANSWGVNITREPEGLWNVIVRNCTIIKTTSTGSNSYGIRMLNTSGSVLENNVISTQGGGNNHGIDIDHGSANRITSNNISANGGSNSWGIYMNNGSINHSIINNLISTNCTNSCLGIYILGSNSINVSSNIFRTGGSGSMNGGIVTGLSSNYTIINNNTIFTNGTSQNHGIETRYNHNTTISYNRIYTNGGSSNYGILLNTSRDSSLISNNITTSGGSSYGIIIDQVALKEANNTLLNNPFDWIFTNTPPFTFNNFRNTTFAMPNGSINIPYNVQLTELQSVTKAKLNIISNKAFLNSTNLTYFNTSGIITLYNLSYVSPKMRVDYNDDGSYEDCPSDVCTNLSYDGSTFVYNMSHFTSYSSAESAITGCPVTINESTTLMQNLSSSTYCIEMGADNIDLDCNGHTVWYGGDGYEGVSAYGRNNLTVRNCTIILNDSSSISSPGILASFTNNSLFRRNTIIINGTNFNHGIKLSTECSNNQILYNSIFTGGNASNYGISVYDMSNNNTVQDNAIVTNGSSDNYGIYAFTSTGNTIFGNTISTAGTDVFNHGIMLDYDANYNTIDLNSINLRSGFGGDYGIFVFSDSLRNNITRNTIVAGNPLGSTQYGIVIESGSDNNSFRFNNITLDVIGSHGIYIQLSSGNAFNTTLINATHNWIYTDGSSGTNFTNTTFMTPHGSILLGNFTFAGYFVSVTGSDLNITRNKAFLNSSNITPMNTSGVVTLKGITYTNPTPVVDFEDDGSYIDCPPSICTALGHSGGEYSFSVTRFTSYSSRESALVGLSKADSPDPATSTLPLSYAITINATGTAENITLTEHYPAEVAYASSQPSPVAGTDNTFAIGNLGANDAVVVNITVLVHEIENNTVINNTVNISYVNSTGALFTANASEGTTVLNNRITNTTITNSTILNCTIINSIIINSNKSNCTIINSRIIDSTNDNTTIIDSNETNSTDRNTEIINATIINSIKIDSFLNNTNLTDSNVTNTTLTNCTVTNSTLYNALNSSCNYTNYRQQQPIPPTPTPSGPGGGSGGAGYGAIPRWPVSPVPFPNQPCVENWECEEWSRCVDGTQSRVCVDLNSCNVSRYLPQTERSCGEERVLHEVPAEPEAPMEMPELRPEQEQPAPEPKSALYTLLPIFIDGALIVLALLVIISILIGTEKRANRALRLAIDVIMVASLAMVLWHYVANNEFLAMQTITFIILLVAVTTMWLTDYLKSRQKQVPEVEFESTAPVLPDGVERIEEPAAPSEMPEPAVQPLPPPEQDVWRPRKIYFLEPVEKAPVAREKPVKKAKEAPKSRIVQPRREIPERMDIDSVLKRSKITLKKLDKTLKSIKKKKIRKK